MALFTWNQNYSVGINSIDQQHKKLVDLINGLHDEMKIGKGKEVLGTILKELVDYTIMHFSYEEKLFASYGYPETQSHKLAHGDLMKQLEKIKSSYDTANNVLTMEVMGFLKTWLSEHILITDKKYSQFFTSKGIK